MRGFLLAEEPEAQDRAPTGPLQLRRYDQSTVIGRYHNVRIDGNGKLCRGTRRPDRVDGRKSLMSRHRPDRLDSSTLWALTPVPWRKLPIRARSSACHLWLGTLSALLMSSNVNLLVLVALDS